MQKLTYKTVDGREFTHTAWCISHLYKLRDFQCELYDEPSCPFTAKEVDTITTQLIAPDVPEAYKALVLKYLGDHINPDFTLTFRRSSSKLYVLFLTTFIRACDEEGSSFYEALMASEGHLLQRLRYFYDLCDDGTLFLANPLHQPGRTFIREHADLIAEHFEEFLSGLQSTTEISESEMYPSEYQTMDYYIETFVRSKSA